MNIDEIPTPETDAMASMRRATSEWVALANNLERRLTIEKNRADDMGKLAHKNACEAMEYRRLLTIAREALRGVHETSSSSRLRRVAKEALALTAPKP